MESLGSGLAAQINERLWLMGGARWLHISNAGRAGDGNPGFDGFRLYFGLWTPL
jgi:hypothetical protein